MTIEIVAHDLCIPLTFGLTMHSWRLWWRRCWWCCEERQTYVCICNLYAWLHDERRNEYKSDLRRRRWSAWRGWSHYNPALCLSSRKYRLVPGAGRSQPLYPTLACKPADRSSFGISSIWYVSSSVRSPRRLTVASGRQNGLRRLWHAARSRCGLRTQSRCNQMMAFAWFALCQPRAPKWTVTSGGERALIRRRGQSTFNVTGSDR